MPVDKVGDAGNQLLGTLLESAFVGDIDLPPTFAGILPNSAGCAGCPVTNVICGSYCKSVVKQGADEVQVPP